MYFADEFHLSHRKSLKGSISRSHVNASRNGLVSCSDALLALSTNFDSLAACVGEVCRKLGISEATFYSWKNKYGGLDPAQLRRLRQLEEENARL